MTRRLTTPRPVPNQPVFRRLSLWRGGALMIFALAAVLFPPSSSAEFEVPYIDSSNAVTNAEFRGVWAFDRGFQYPFNPPFEGYEAFAVGVDTTKVDGDCSGGGPKEKCNGAFYFYNGSIWSRITTILSKENSDPEPEVFSLNAVAGQLDPQMGSLGKLLAIGDGGKIAKMQYIYDRNIGVGTSRLINYDTYHCQATQSQSCYDNTTCNAFIPGDYCAFNNMTIEDDSTGQKRDWYAIDAVQEYAQEILVGGQAGLIAKGPTVSTPTDPKPFFTTITTSGIAATESVTGIKFVDNEIAYVVTSTFPEITPGGERKSPYDRDCPNLPPTVSNLYKVDFTTVSDGFWTKIIPPALIGEGNCFYGLAVAQKTDLTPVLWVASQKGVYQYDTAGAGTWTTGGGTSIGKAYHAVVAINQRTGAGTNLLNNGTFEYDKKGWVELGNLGGTRRYMQLNGTCIDFTGDQERSIIPTGGAVDNGKYLKVTSQAIYENPCNPKYNSGFTTGVIQSIPFSTIEGQRYKVSGYYKVEWQGQHASAVDTKNAQGGMVLACEGSNVQSEVRFVDCSTSYRKLIHVKDPSLPYQGATKPADATNPNGWIPFEFIISREDGIFKNISRGPFVYRSKRTMNMRIQCEATYGATVSCDELKVEAIDEPTTQMKNGVIVIAAGDDLAVNGIAINEDALVSNIYAAESIPGKVRADKNAGFGSQINSMFAVGSQHIYAVGRGYKESDNSTAGLAIFNRTPSTLRGTIWAGATSPASDTTPSATGSISVSCVDDRGVNGSQQTLCQRSPESYGMSLEITSLYSATKTGRLTGRGWFGKTPDDQESLDLGRCLGSVDPDPTKGDDPDPAKSNYVTYYNILGSCDTIARRCRGLKLDSNWTGTNTSIACITDFDCLGRCEKDRGFVCLKDDDCRKGPLNLATYLNQEWIDPFGDKRFQVAPYARLTCGNYVSEIQASPLACRPMGWLSFNANDFSPAARVTPKIGEAFGVEFNTKYTGHNSIMTDVQNRGAHELAGWGRFMTMKTSDADGGWVRLRGDLENNTPTIIDGSSSFFGCYNCAGTTVDAMNCAFCQDNDGRSCVPDDNEVTAACYNVCKNSITTHCATANDCLVALGYNSPCITPGVCRLPLGGGSNAICTDTSTCASSEDCVSGTICKSDGVTQCAQYGVNLDTTTNKFKGYAWSEDFGWLDFSEVSYGGTRLLQTKLGDIYAGGQIGDEKTVLPPGATSCNATYLITSVSSITGFCSATPLGADKFSPLRPNSPTLPILSAENSFQNILGRFDLVGIEKDIGSGKNKYGAIIEKLTPPGVDITGVWSAKMVGANKHLAGKVYIVGDLAIPTTYNLDAPISFDNGTAGVSGAGILVVKGNLNISGDMSYVSLNALGYDIRRLASLTVVVRGDLTIENSVQKMVGAYYVTGKINTATADVSTNISPLTVSGLMIAKEFNFARKFAGTIENPSPSELIIYDGRLQSNPLPGMTDFASALPNSASANR